MYVRQPNQSRQNIRVPENYSGSAFGNNGYSDMPPPARSTPRYDLPPNSDRDLPQGNSFSEQRLYGKSEQDYEIIKEREKSVQEANEISPPYFENDEADVSAEDLTQKNGRESKKSNSLFSSLLPQLANNSNNFPFGHGLGSEELLILGVMLLVYMSGNELGELDREFMLILGLLLFAG